MSKQMVEVEEKVRAKARIYEATSKVEIVGDDGRYVLRAMQDDRYEVRLRHRKARRRRAVAHFGPTATGDFVKRLIDMCEEEILAQPLFVSYIEAFPADPEDILGDREWWVVATIDREDTGEEWTRKFTGLGRDAAMIMEQALQVQAALLEQAQGWEDGWYSQLLRRARALALPPASEAP